MIHVFLPTQLDTYTDGKRELELDLGARAPLTLYDVVQALDERYRGMAFRIIDEHQRIRRHIAIFVGENMVRELSVPLTGNERVQIVGALSGG